MIKLKNLIILFLVYLGVPLFSQDINEETNEFAWSFIYINDNYTATWLKEKPDNYIGADDFLTASFLLRIYHDSWRYAINYNTITSRYFNFRYDLLTTSISRQFVFNHIEIHPEIGLLFKGDFGGKDLQNGWHKMRDIRKVNIPYSTEKGTAFLMAVKANWFKKSILDVNDRFSVKLNARLLSDFVPLRLIPALAYRMAIYNPDITFELFLGWQFYLNKQQQYSEFIEQGIYAAFNSKVQIYKHWYVDMGFSLSPVRNIEEAPQYGTTQFNYLPQMWLGFSWNTAWQSLNDFIDY